MPLAWKHLGLSVPGCWTPGGVALHDSPIVGAATARRRSISRSAPATPRRRGIRGRGRSRRDPGRPRCCNEQGTRLGRVEDPIARSGVGLERMIACLAHVDDADEGPFNDVARRSRHARIVVSRERRCPMPRGSALVAQGAGFVAPPTRPRRRRCMTASPRFNKRLRRSSANERGSLSAQAPARRSGRGHRPPRTPRALRSADRCGQCCVVRTRRGDLTERHHSGPPRHTIEQRNSALASPLDATGRPSRRRTSTPHSSSRSGSACHYLWRRSRTTRCPPCGALPTQPSALESYI